jgi:hypothetical protein
MSEPYLARAKDRLKKTTTGYIFPEMTHEQAEWINYFLAGRPIEFNEIKIDGRRFYILVEDMEGRTKPCPEEFKSAMEGLCVILKESPKPLVTIHTSSTYVEF